MNIQDNKNAPRDAIAAAQQYVNIKKNAVKYTMLILVFPSTGKTDME